MLALFMTFIGSFMGCQGANSGPPVPPQKVESTLEIKLTEPKPDKDHKLQVVAGSEFVVAIRIANLDKNLCPDVVFARFLRGNDNAMSGEFLAKQQPIGKDEMEYKVKVAAPKKLGNYRLEVTPSSISESTLGSPAKNKYPSFDVEVK